MSLERAIRNILVMFLSLAVFVPGVSNGRAIGLPIPDTNPPVIVHSPMKQITEGMPVRIQATVTDNNEVNKVMLNYRRKGDNAYLQTRMIDTGGSNIYSVDLPDNIGKRIEYFIEAIDTAGNDIKGEPYEITVPAVSMKLTGVAPLDTEESVLKLQSRKDGVSKWVWIGLGVLAVGALANSGGGESNNNISSTGSTTANGTDTIPGNSGLGAGIGTVTINAPVPQP